MLIKVLDAVDCQITESTKEELKWLKGLLSYRAVYYKRGQFGSKRKDYDKSLVVRIRGRGDFLPTGFLPRVEAAARDQGMDVQIEGAVNGLVPNEAPDVPGVVFRPDQIRLIDAAVREQRGVLVSPPGSGKTWVLMGLLSRFPDSRALIVTHSTSIVLQTMKELHNHGFCVGEPPTGDLQAGGVVVTTRQQLVGQACPHCKSHGVGSRDKIKKVFTCKSCGASFSDRIPQVKPHHQEWMRELDIVVVDEAHLFGGDGNSQYTLIMRNTLAPVRIGLTGTAPDPEKEVGMVLEGMLGPVIEKVSYEEGNRVGILSNVKFEFIRVPKRPALGDLKQYDEIHQNALVENRQRNLLILDKVAELIGRGMTVLVFINQIAQGRCLQELASLLDLDVLFIQGSTENEVREEVKQGIIDGEIRCVISSKIWREGVNIPNLGAVILAAGGKAELSNLQSIGRGLRSADGKEHAVIVDLLDPYRYLAEHTVQRIGFYVDHGWV